MLLARNDGAYKYGYYKHKDKHYRGTNINHRLVGQASACCSRVFSGREKVGGGQEETTTSSNENEIISLDQAKSGGHDDEDITIENGKKDNLGPEKGSTQSQQDGETTK